MSASIIFFFYEYQWDKLGRTKNEIIEMITDQWSPVCCNVIVNWIILFTFIGLSRMTLSRVLYERASAESFRTLRSFPSTDNERFAKGAIWRSKHQSVTIIIAMNHPRKVSNDVYNSFVAKKVLRHHFAWKILSSKIQLHRILFFILLVSDFYSSNIIEIQQHKQIHAFIGSYRCFGKRNSKFPVIFFDLEIVFFFVSNTLECYVCTISLHETMDFQFYGLSNIKSSDSKHYKFRLDRTWCGQNRDYIHICTLSHAIIQALAHHTRTCIAVLLITPEFYHRIYYFITTAMRH